MEKETNWGVSLADPKSEIIRTRDLAVRENTAALSPGIRLGVQADGGFANGEPFLYLSEKQAQLLYRWLRAWHRRHYGRNSA